MIEGLRVLRTTRVIVPFFYNIIAYSIFYIIIILIACALRIKMPFYYLMTGMSAAMIFSAIPISIAGLGVREATLLFFFSPLAIKNEIIMSLSLLYFMLCLILPGLIGLIPFFSQPSDIRKTLSDVKESEI